MSLRPTTRKKSYKVAVDVDEARKKREDSMVLIRENMRNDGLQKKRRVGLHEKLLSPIQPPSMGMGLESLTVIATKIWSGEDALQLEAAVAIRVLIDGGHIDDIINSGVIPRLVEFLRRHDFQQLQACVGLCTQRPVNIVLPPFFVFEQTPYAANAEETVLFHLFCILELAATWALTGIASGTSANTEVVVDHGAVPSLVELLTSPNIDIQEHAICALSIVAGKAPTHRDLVLSNGALLPILSLLHENIKPSMLTNAAWAISNVCRGKPHPPTDQIKLVLPVLEKLICSTDEEVIESACWGFSYLSDGTTNDIEMVINTGVCGRLVELLLHPSSSVIIPALSTVRNIVSGNTMQMQVIIDCHPLSSLVVLLYNSQDRSIKKDACFIISTITAGNTHQIQAVIESNLLPHLLYVFHLSEYEIKKELTIAISNALSGGTYEQIKYFVRQGCIKPLCDLLVSTNLSVIMVCLVGLDKILEVGEAEKSQNTRGSNFYAQLIEDANGLERIAGLQNHDNKEIYDMAVKILDTYWLEEEAERNLLLDEHYLSTLDAQPDLPSDGFGFN